eukprot:s1207_g4.t1
MAGVALGDIDLRSVWQAWHLWHWAGSGDALGSGLVACDAAAFCVAGVAFGDIGLHFVWQAWHLATSTSILCGRRGAYGIGLGLVTRLGPLGVAFGDIRIRFVWQALPFWHWAGSGDALGSGLVACDAAAFCVAGVDLHFVWQAWRLETSTFVLCGRRGTR